MTNEPEHFDVCGFNFQLVLVVCRFDSQPVWGFEGLIPAMSWVFVSSTHSISPVFVGPFSCMILVYARTILSLF